MNDWMRWFIRARIQVADDKDSKMKQRKGKYQ